MFLNMYGSGFCTAEKQAPEEEKPLQITGSFLKQRQDYL